MTEKVSDDFRGFVARPLCPFCSAPFSDDMMGVWNSAEVETGYYGDVDGVDVCTLIDITCSSCERLVYRKECFHRGGGWSSDNEWHEAAEVKKSDK